MFRATPILSVLVIALGSSAAHADVADWVTSLSHGDTAERIEAAHALAELGPQADSAVPALVKAIQADSLELRFAASVALAKIGPDAKGAVAALTDNLSDSNSMVRTYAAFALGKIGDSNQATVEALIEASIDPDPMVRSEVLGALHAIDPPRELTLPMWVKALTDADPRVVLPALRTLADAGIDSLPGLREALKHDEACYWACLVAAEIGPDADPLVPEIVDILKHEDAECRMQALVTLGEIGPGADAAVPAIVSLLEEEQLLSVRYAAAFALGRIVDSSAAKEALATLYKSDDVGLRTIAAWSLIELDPAHATDEVRKTMIAALAAEDDAIRQIALRALREMPVGKAGPSPAVTEAMANMLQNASPEIVDDVIKALASRGEAALPGVIRGIHDEKLRPLAVQVALRLGKKAEPATAALVEALEETKDDTHLRREIQFALGGIGPPAAGAVPELIKSLESDNLRVRNSACYALGMIGPAAKEATSALTRQMRSDGAFTPVASIWALLRIHPNNPRIQQVAVPLLIKALDDEREQVRAEMAVALGDIGSAAKEATARLTQALQDESPLVRSAAQQALQKLQGE